MTVSVINATMFLPRCIIDRVSCYQIKAALLPRLPDYRQFNSA
jgi:hypothetical protein